jgi:hypothetical protein
MKKIVLIMVFGLITFGTIGSLVYYLYVIPLIIITEIDIWYAGGIFITVSTMVYVLIAFGFFKLHNWLLDNINQDKNPIYPYCGKYKRSQGNGIMHQLCECRE